VLDDARLEVEVRQEEGHEKRSTTMTLDPLLIEVLACPDDKGTLLYFEEEDLLYNPRLHRAYEVRDGIPVMLIEEARSVDDEEHGRLMATAESGGARTTGETDGS
jgi:uncharacterized protein